MTLTFDPLILNFCVRWGIVWSIHVPNLSEISQYAAELLMINDRFFVRFRGCSNLSIGDLTLIYPPLFYTLSLIHI